MLRRSVWVEWPKLGRRLGGEGIWACRHSKGLGSIPKAVGAHQPCPLAGEAFAGNYSPCPAAHLIPTVETEVSYHFQVPRLLVCLTQNRHSAPGPHASEDFQGPDFLPAGVWGSLIIE